MISFFNFFSSKSWGDPPNFDNMFLWLSHRARDKKIDFFRVILFILTFWRFPVSWCHFLFYFFSNKSWGDQPSFTNMFLWLSRTKIRFLVIVFRLTFWNFPQSPFHDIMISLFILFFQHQKLRRWTKCCQHWINWWHHMRTLRF